MQTEAIQELLLAMADDELILGHRDSEWTGFAPILEEDIAFSNIAQDEMGHSLVWYTLLEQMNSRNPDEVAFGRKSAEYRCCRFVQYPKGDFAYTVVRQYMFDEAEHVRLEAFGSCSYLPIKEAASKIILEEAYHLLHSKGLIQRLGDATGESHQRMQSAVDSAFAQSLGIFEALGKESELVSSGVFPGNDILKERWLQRIVPTITQATLILPVSKEKNGYAVNTQPDAGGRQGKHTEHLEKLLEDMQSVYRSVPGGTW